MAITTNLRDSVVLCLLAILCLSGNSLQADSIPPRNPYLADSHWPMLHGGSDAQKSNPFAGPLAPSKNNGRKLTREEIIFKPVGPIEVISLNWSGPYPDGRQAIWIGSHQHLVKLDASTLETLSTYVMREGNYYGDGDVERINGQYDQLVADKDYQGLFDLADEIAGSRLRDPHMGNSYAFTNHNNERVFYYRDETNGAGYLRFFGDAVEGDIASPIVLKRQWRIPKVDDKLFIPFAFNMTFDGWIIMASNSGILMAVSQDFSTYHNIDLAADKNIDSNLDSISSYVRSGINIDEDNGIYVVTNDVMVRVQWTGKRLSMDPGDGAWTSEYPSGPRGSGTTPVLMGFGDNEDKLVLIGDGTADDPHLMLFWRDRIPNNWQGLEGYDRRVAGVAEVEWPDGKSRFIVENSPAVMNFGIFATPETPSKEVKQQGSVVKQLIAETLSTALPGWEAVGGTRWEWDTAERELRRKWMTPLKLVASMCSISRPNRLLYCIGRRDEQFTLEAIDWDSGESAFHYVLGKSMKYFAYNSLVVTPDGDVDLHGWFGMGLVRMSPKQGHSADHPYNDPAESRQGSLLERLLPFGRRD